MLKRAEEYTWKHIFDRDAFLKDIGVSARALKWSINEQNDIADIAENYIADQKNMINKYKKYIEK